MKWLKYFLLELYILPSLVDDNGDPNNLCKAIGSTFNGSLVLFSVVYFTSTFDLSIAHASDLS